MHEQKLGHPEDDQLRASINEIHALGEHPAWLDVIDHFEEVARGHKMLLARKGIDEREADFSRGVIANCEDLQNILGMFIQYIEDTEELENAN